MPVTKVTTYLFNPRGTSGVMLTSYWTISPTGRLVTYIRHEDALQKGWIRYLKVVGIQTNTLSNSSGIWTSWNEHLLLKGNAIIDGEAFRLLDDVLHGRTTGHV